MLPSSPRVLTVRPGPHYSVLDVHNGWVEGLTAAGCEVVDFNLDDRLDYHAAHPKVGDSQTAAVLAAESLEAACYQFWPHIVLVTSGFYIPPSTFQRMRDRGHRTVLHVTESPYEDDRHATKPAHVDLTLVNDPVNLHLYQQHGKAVYQPQCYRPSLHHPGSEARTVPFGWVGTAYPSRIDFLEQVDWPCTPYLGGNWRDLPETSPLAPFVESRIGLCVDNDDTADLYRRTQVGANWYRREATATADGLAVGPREVEMAACGLPFLRERREESDRLFPNHPTFETPDDFGRQLTWLLDRPDVRDRLSREGQEAVADRSFVKAAKRLLLTLDKE